MAAVANVYRVAFHPESTLRERLGRTAASAADRVMVALLTRVMGLQHP